jgi:hypothetical protein
MEGLKAIPMVFLLIAVAGIIGGAGVISTAKFGDTVDKCWNSSFTYSGGQCVNATSGVTTASSSPDDTNMTYEFYAANKATEGQVDIAEQLPTVAIIAIMVVIISIIAGVFVYLRYFQ